MPVLLGGKSASPSTSLPEASINDVTASEADGSAVLTVTMSPAPISTVSVDFTTRDGTAVAVSDYTATSGTLTFVAGQTSQAVIVTLTDDPDIEGGENFFVDLVNPVDCAIADGTGQVTLAYSDLGEILDTETFAAGFGNWTTPGSLFPQQSWTRTTGATPSANGGPEGGSDPATRAVNAALPYAYTEAGDAGNQWTMQSPEIDASLGVSGLSFDVHMRFGATGGTADGTLKVQGYNGTAWVDISAAITGSQQAASSSPYLRSAAFGSYTSAGFGNADFRFRLLFERGAGPFPGHYDAAVDNLIISGPEGAIAEPPPVDNSLFPATIFGGQFAPWAIPASEIATHANSAALVAEVYNAMPNGPTLNVDRFAQAFYSLADANATINFVRTETSFGGNLNTGAQIPWNFAEFTPPMNFDPSDGDSYVMLTDPVTGEQYEFFQTVVVNGQLEAARGTHHRTGVDNDGPIANIFTKQNANRNSRACGIQRCVGPIQRTDIDQGRIDHCMNMSYPNPTQSAHEPFAIKGAGGTGGPAGRGFMGLRIHWQFTDTQIDNFINTQPVNARVVLRIVLNGLREFGVFIGDHAGTQSVGRGAISFEHELTAKWSEIGFDQSLAGGAIRDLIVNNQSIARVLSIPVHADGTDASVACYPGIPYPAGHPCNGVV